MPGRGLAMLAAALAALLSAPVALAGPEDSTTDAVSGSAALSGARALVPVLDPAGGGGELDLLRGGRVRRYDLPAVGLPAVARGRGGFAAVWDAPGRVEFARVRALRSPSVLDDTPGDPVENMSLARNGTGFIAAWSGLDTLTIVRVGGDGRRAFLRRIGVNHDVEASSLLGVSAVPGGRDTAWVVSGEDNGTYARRVAANGYVGPPVRLASGSDRPFTVAPDGRGGLYGIATLLPDFDNECCPALALVHLGATGSVQRARVRGGRGTRLAGVLRVRGSAARVIYSDYSRRGRSRRGVFVRRFSRAGKLGKARRLARRGDVADAELSRSGRLNLLLGLGRDLFVGPLEVAGGADTGDLLVAGRRRYVVWESEGCGGNGQAIFARAVRGRRKSQARRLGNCR